MPRPPALTGPKSVAARARSRRRSRRSDGTRGFTLFETLIAVAVIAALLGVLPRALVEARQNIDRSHDWLHARLVAEALLAEELAAIDVAQGVFRGRTDGRDWIVRIEGAGALPPEERNARLYVVRLTVEVAEDRTLSVETLRLGRAR